VSNSLRILITGADGFIGSHLTEELVRQGHNVRAFVFYNSFNSWGWLGHVPKDNMAALNSDRRSALLKLRSLEMNISGYYQC
jgi:nucleoside-diphosphate-sugar epimerase